MENGNWKLENIQQLLIAKSDLSISSPITQWLNSSSPSVLDSEPGVFSTHRLFRFLDARHTRASRAFSKVALEFFQREFVADGVDFHATRREIFHVATNPQLIGYAFGKITEPNALNPTRNHVRPGNLHPV
jgi:hypothetical protein